jgi:uncharacterized small protein (DUF1192 family)
VTEDSFRPNRVSLLRDAIARIRAEREEQDQET